MDRPKIKTFWLALGYGCNNRCRGCYAEDSGFAGEWMPLSRVTSIMGMMQSMGAKDCLLIGGEPTLYPQLQQLISEGSSRGIDMKIVTNGRKLASKTLLNGLISGGLRHASVSIEGADPKTHNKITRTKSYDQVVRAIGNLLATGLTFNTLMTISRLNYQEVVPLAEKLHEMGVKNILYNVGLPSCGSSSESSNSFSLSPVEVAGIMAEAYHKLSSQGIKAKFFATIPLCLFDKELLDEMVAQDWISKGVHCHIFYGSGVVFEPDGNVLPCTHFVKHPLFNMIDEGIQTADQFSEVWYGERGIHGAFREAIWKYPHSNCEGCEHWGKCVGGCPFLWTHFDPMDIISIR